MNVQDKIERVWEAVQLVYCRYLGRSYSFGCGHTALWITALTINGDRYVLRRTSQAVEYCPECWAKAAIRCTWCGETIMADDPITLYTPRVKDFSVPEHAVVYRREPSLQLVGCLLMNCAESGADLAGFWVMPGRVEQVMSPLEMLVANDGLDCVINSDLSDPNEAMPMPDEDSDT